MCNMYMSCRLLMKINGTYRVSQGPISQVTQFAEWPQCALRQTANMKCVAPECGNLCYHQYRCDSSCYDYTNGHICKHLHRVHSMKIATEISTVADTDTSTSVDDTLSDSTPQSASYHLPQNSGKSTSGLISFSTLQYTRYTVL